MKRRWGRTVDRLLWRLFGPRGHSATRVFDRWPQLDADDKGTGEKRFR